jgi:transcriptional regulator of acetoin/glycerol metabolism
VVVIAALHYVEKGMKAQTALKDMQLKEANNKKHEDDKVTKASMKKAQRDEQKRATQKLKAEPKGGVAHLFRNVHQPDKSK